MRLKQFATLALLAVLGSASWAQAAPEPVNPHATPEARALLAYLYSISGKATITGQHNFPNVGARWTDMAYDLTGKYPGLRALAAGHDRRGQAAIPERRGNRAHLA
jgi:mannan endo-1,4-beta-mannosidase